MTDLVRPKVEGAVTLKDLCNPERLSLVGVFFNILFNLNKFIAYEQRDPFAAKQLAADPTLTVWVLFARTEYARLAMEEESREEEASMDAAGSPDGVDGWYEDGEDVS